jgi:hypothetical protein
MRQTYSRILLVALVIIFPSAAMACSCARNPTAESILESATAVFTGVVRKTVPVATGRSMTTFTVVESFKGVAGGATARVRHPSGSSASCGVKFLPGETYTLAAHGAESGLVASLCSTWMFSPQSGRRTDLIQRMRAIRRRP